VSFNQLKFSPCASWSVNGTTFANITILGSGPYNVFITTNNTIYSSLRTVSRVLAWSGMSNTPTRNMTTGLYTPRGLFINNNGDIYIDNGVSRSQVELWTPNATVGRFIMPATNSCYALFVDINNTLYCSLDSFYQVIKKPLSSTSNATFLAAGNGTYGSGPYMLKGPNGIFVDTDLNLYVVDCFNHRIQRFQAGQLFGTTVAGSGAPDTITLHRPTEVVLDSDGYLFITDSGNHRIVASGPTGFRCIAGCLGGNGSQPFQFDSPRSIAFDSSGNMFVADSSNRRLQRFSLASNSCGK
jgi:tripartite motif-containing protein 71